MVYAKCNIQKKKNNNGKIQFRNIAMNKYSIKQEETISIYVSYVNDVDLYEHRDINCYWTKKKKFRRLIISNMRLLGREIKLKRFSYVKYAL